MFGDAATDLGALLGMRIPLGRDSDPSFAEEICMSIDGPHPAHPLRPFDSTVNAQQHGRGRSGTVTEV